MRVEKKLKALEKMLSKDNERKHPEGKSEKKSEYDGKSFEEILSEKMGEGREESKPEAENEESRDDAYATMKKLLEIMNIT